MEVSHPERIVFPDDTITKGEVVEYYEMVAERMLPHIAGRALTVERYPKGIGAKGFMQKNAPSHFGEELVDHHTVDREEGGTTTYPVVHSAIAIPAFANLGVITFHVPCAKVDDPMHPDWVVWDLDPPPGETALVRDAAFALRDVLETFGIATRIMTSGSNGYHLRCRLDGETRFEDVALVARGSAALASAGHPDLMTIEFLKKNRRGRVFVDWLRNAPYATSVAPWSLRPRSGAPVAVPIDWDEVERIAPDGVRIGDVRDREDRLVDMVPVSLASVVGDVSAALDEAGITLEPFDRFRG